MILRFGMMKFLLVLFIVSSLLSCMEKSGLFKKSIVDFDVTDQLTPNCDDTP